jgi:hypothetical protein
MEVECQCHGVQGLAAQNLGGSRGHVTDSSQTSLQVVDIKHLFMALLQVAAGNLLVAVSVLGILS